MLDTSSFLAYRLSFCLIIITPFSSQQMMPHSTVDGVDTRRHTQAPAKSMTSSSSFAPNGRSNGGSSAIDNKWKRASLPISDIYSEYGSRNAEANGRGRSGSIVSTGAALHNRRSQYYDENRDLSSTVKEKVLRDSPIIAELRTNVIVSSLAIHFMQKLSLADQG